MDVLNVVEENGKFGFADENGKIVIPCKFADAGNFIGNLALVALYDINDSLHFYIDKDANVVCSDCYSLKEASIIYDSILKAQQSRFKEALELITSIQWYDEDEKPLSLAILYCRDGKLYDALSQIMSHSYKFKETCNVYDDYLKLDIGDLYRDGVGTEKNLIKAKEWYTDAWVNSSDDEIANYVNEQLQLISKEHPELFIAQDVTYEEDFD